MITKWDGDRRAEDERPIEAGGETIEKIWHPGRILGAIRNGPYGKLESLGNF
jgi:hypothetical protein